MGENSHSQGTGGIEPPQIRPQELTLLRKKPSDAAYSIENGWYLLVRSPMQSRGRVDIVMVLIEGHEMQVTEIEIDKDQQRATLASACLY